jgi:hypothetical protein
MKTNYFKIALLLLSFTSYGLFAQTSERYLNTFDNPSDLYGWAFTSPNIEVNIQNGQLVIDASANDFFHFFTPLGVTQNDFSVKMTAPMDEAITGGFMGRMAFKSMIGILGDEDGLYAVYTTDIASYEDPEFNYLFDFPYPAYDIYSVELKVSKTGNDLLVSMYINNALVQSGVITNADESLMYGHIILGFTSDDESFTMTLEDVDIHYNPMIEPGEDFIDNFSNNNSPWFRTGTFEHVTESMYILNGKLHFNYAGSGEVRLMVMSPVGGVGDFIAAFDIGGNSMDGTFAVSRALDYKHYITLFYEDDEMFLGFANGDWEPTIINSGPADMAEVEKVKFSITQSGLDAILQVWHDNVAVLSGTIQNVPNRLLYGHLFASYEYGNDIDVWFDEVQISYDPVIVGTIENQASANLLQLGQNNPNPFPNSTIISYSIQMNSQVQLIIYDLLGNPVLNLDQGFKNAGNHIITLDGTGLAEGIYFYQLKTNLGSETRKMVLHR